MNILILQMPTQASTKPIASLLVAAGHECVLSPSGPALLEQLQTSRFDLLVIDALLAEGALAALLSAARAGAGGKLPVLLLADSDDNPAILAALAFGVDDYLIKPVRRSELLARVRVLLRRAWPDSHATTLLQFEAFAFDTLAGSVTRDGTKITLTQKEFDLALLFFRHLGQPLSRATLLETLWTQDTDTPSRTVDTHVSRVRSKLGLHAPSGFRLAPVYAYGYLLERA